MKFQFWKLWSGGIRKPENKKETRFYCCFFLFSNLSCGIWLT